MPIYEYQARESTGACIHCRDGFEVIQALSEAPLSQCPHCGAAVLRCYSAPAVGRSASGLDDRAKAAGFTKLKRLGKGEYEKQY